MASAVHFWWCNAHFDESPGAYRLRGIFIHIDSLAIFAISVSRLPGRYNLPQLEAGMSSSTGKGAESKQV